MNVAAFYGMGLHVAGVFFTEQLIEGMQDPSYLCGRPAPCRIDLTFQLLLELEVAHMAVQESVIAKASYQQNTKSSTKQYYSRACNGGSLHYGCFALKFGIERSLRSRGFIVPPEVWYTIKPRQPNNELIGLTREYLMLRKCGSTMQDRLYYSSRSSRSSCSTRRSSLLPLLHQPHFPQVCSPSA